MGAKVGVTYSLERKLAPYAEAVRLGGLEPVPISPERPGSLDGLRGLVITGGCDIDPARYGQAPLSVNDQPDRARDELECSLLAEAIAADLPVLGICRGLQLLNVACGGTLHQDIPGHRVKNGIEVHTVAMRPGTRLAAILGNGEYSVNSRHHQAAGRIGEGLAVVAAAPDGTVEGLEMPGRRFVLAVQWHPEDRVRTHPLDLRLFEALAEAVR